MRAIKQGHRPADSQSIFFAAYHRQQLQKYPAYRLTAWQTWPFIQISLAIASVNLGEVRNDNLRPDY